MKNVVFEPNGNNDHRKLLGGKLEKKTEDLEWPMREGRSDRR